MPFKRNRRSIITKLALVAVLFALVTVGNLNPLLAAQHKTSRSGNIVYFQQASDKIVKHTAFGPKGEWLILYGLNGYASNGLADAVLTKLSAVNDAKEEIQWMSFGPDGAWLISTEKSFYFDSLPDEMKTEIDRLIAAGNGSDIKYVAFSPDGGWVIIWGSNGYTAKALP